MIEFEHLGKISFTEARARQEAVLKACLADELRGGVIFCEHPPTLTLGKRTKEEHLLQNISEFKKRGIEVLNVDRGGSVTFHGPGQLMIYPVLNIRHLGLKRFVRRGLEALAEYSSNFGVLAEADLEQAGVWIKESSGSRKKIASVGLRIVHAFSNHGFSLQLGGDLAVFQDIQACGCKLACMTSLEAESGQFINFEETAGFLEDLLLQAWSKPKAEQKRVINTS